jgi:hypothetical protein
MKRASELINQAARMQEAPTPIEGILIDHGDLQVTEADPVKVALMVSNHFATQKFIEARGDLPEKIAVE